MKILRMIGLGTVVVVILALVGGFIFLKTLDVNKYIPAIEEQVRKSAGRDILIGRADLTVSLFRGMSIDVSDISLSDDHRFSEQAFLTVNRVVLGVNFWPLIFERKIQIAEVLMDTPKVIIIRNREGLINAAMMGAAPSSDRKEPRENDLKSTAALPALLADRVRIVNASVTYIDELFSPKLALTVDHLDFMVKDFSLTEPFTYELKAALFSQDQDIVLKGKARMDLGTLSVWAMDSSLDVNVSKISADRLNAMLPMAGPAGLKDPLKGQLAILVSELRAGVNGLQALRMNGSLTGGQVESSLIPFPLENVTLIFDADAKDLVIKSCDLNLAEGTVGVTGIIRSYLSLPAMDLVGKVRELELQKISTAYKLSVKASGKANADIKLSMAGKAPQELISSLKAEMSGSVKDGALEGINLAQMGLDNIPMLPALWEMVQPSLPPETQEDFKKGVTLMESADVLIRMNGLEVTVERAEVVTRDAVASAKGTAKIPELVDLNIDLYLQRKLADALVKKVSDLSGIQDDQGKLYIPLRIKGAISSPKIEADVDYLSKRLIANRGQEVLQKVLEKNPGAQEILNTIFGAPQPETKPQGEAAQPAGQEDGTSAQETQPEASQAVKVLLNSLFKKK